MLGAGPAGEPWDVPFEPEVPFEPVATPAQSCSTDSPLALAVAARAENAVERRFGFDVSVPPRVEAL